ncbi:MAG TPA: hypothetical protein VIF57_27060 [Polyangia bacterium]|jgi:hypothetical protein
MSRPFRVTRAQARELGRIKERTQRQGGTPHDQVVRRMHARMTRDLRRLVKAYKHPSRGITDILELLALSRAEGIDVTTEIDELLAKIASKARAA